MDIYFKTEQEKRKLENYWTIRKAITTRNRFNTIISKRNTRFKPNTRLVKKMTPCPSPINIFPIIQIDNRFHLGLSYKTWMLAKNIFEKQHINNVGQFFEEQKYVRTITWNEKKDSPQTKITPTERPKQTNYSSNNYGSRRYRSRYRYCKDLYTYRTPEPEIIITTYQTSQLKEKIYLLPLILFKQMVDELDDLKRKQKKSITFDECRKQKEWSTSMHKNPFRKKDKYDWLEMGKKTSRTLDENNSRKNNTHDHRKHTKDCILFGI
jgi:hypothetical protein